MKGSGNLLGKLPTTIPVASSYSATYKGLMSRYSNKPIELATQSCSTGVVVPDPLILKTMRNKE